MIICDERYPAVLDEIAEFLTPFEVELNFCDGEEMRALNLKTRKIDKSTDVLSFPFAYVPHAPLGVVVINSDEAAAVATRLGHSYEDEVALLFTHGLLHVLGFDHEKDNGEMRNKEVEVIARFSLPESLIVRNS